MATSLTNPYSSILKPFFVWQNKLLKKINPEDVICLSTEGNYAVGVQLKKYSDNKPYTNNPVYVVFMN